MSNDESGISNELLSKRQVATLLGVSQTWVTKLDDKLKPELMNRGRHQERIYHRSVVEGYLASRKPRQPSVDRWRMLEDYVKGQGFSPTEVMLLWEISTALGVGSMKAHEDFIRRMSRFARQLKREII